MKTYNSQKSDLALFSNSCSDQKGGPKRSKKVELFDEFSGRLTFDPSFESSRQGEKDSIICSYSKNEPIARYRRVNLKIVIFESSISPSSSKTRTFKDDILSFQPRINQEQHKELTENEILELKFNTG